MVIGKKTGIARRHEEDVDSDGDTEFVILIRQKDANLICDSKEGTLVSEIYDRFLIKGIDDIRMIGGE